MTDKLTQRDKLNLALAGIMTIGFAVAAVAGLVAIVRFGQPDSAMATLVAETGAWIFAGAFLVSFFRALKDSVKTSHGAV
jgi:cytochrome bd-type quinol oxidase subunit 1